MAHIEIITPGEEEEELDQRPRLTSLIYIEWNDCYFPDLGSFLYFQYLSEKSWKPYNSIESLKIIFTRGEF